VIWARPLGAPTALVAQWNPFIEALEAIPAQPFCGALSTIANKTGQRARRRAFNTGLRDSIQPA
jgi:hypothetical protein